MTTHVLVVGGGRVGTALTRLLLAGDHAVTVLDDRPTVLTRLRDEFDTEIVFDGRPTDPGALESAGIRRMAVVAAVTSSDEQNLVVTGLARLYFGVARTVARIVDPARAWMYVPELGVDVALNQADLMAHVVAEEMSVGEMMLLLKLRRGQYALVEERVHPRASAVGRELGTLPLPPDSGVVAILRDGRLIPHDTTVVLQPGDEVLAIVHAGSAANLAQLFGPGPQTGGAPILRRIKGSQVV